MPDKANKPAAPASSAKPPASTAVSQTGPAPARRNVPTVPIKLEHTPGLEIQAARADEDEPIRLARTPGMRINEAREIAPKVPAARTHGKIGK